MYSEETLFQEIRETRDRLRLRAHLGTVELRTQWKDLEAKWKELIDRTTAPSGLEEFGRELASELKGGYERLEAAMKNVRHQVSEPCLERKEVEQLAYELWNRRGRPMGSPDEDWHRAEDLLSIQEAKVSQAVAASEGFEDDGFPAPNWN